jgi:glycosyltransferase involved in cell wall biosynthesis
MKLRRFDQGSSSVVEVMPSANLKFIAYNPPSNHPVTKIQRVVLIGNYPPRRCGIATFTCDVREALISAYPSLSCDVVAMTDEGAHYDYPEEVRFTIRQNEPMDYMEAARRINALSPDVVCVQHEFGIFGGAAGEHLIKLLDALTCPVVSALHTILEKPNGDQRRVFDRLINRSSSLIVMAERGREMLERVWRVPADKIVLVPHGAPDRPLSDTAPAKARLGFAGREVLFTFGLLSPGKGIETAIRAIPKIAAARPDILYVVLGATHPHLVAREGEAYRDSLQALVDDLGVGQNVRFINTYTDTPKLLDYLEAADIYVTPYLNEAQITSGTLSYAAALGKPIISTPYWHAQELLADGRGVLTPFGDVDAISTAAIDLLSNPERLQSLRRRIYEAARVTIWSRLAERYVKAFETMPKAAAVINLRSGQAMQRKARPEPSLAGVRRMTDSCGMLQHSVFSLPDRRHGYCVDDNARALLLMHKMPGEPDEERKALSTIYATFVQHAWNDDVGAFRNFMSYERTWLEDRGSEDSIGRSFWAVAVTAVEAYDVGQRRWAEDLIGRVWPHLVKLTSLRTNAFLLLGVSALIEGGLASGEMREHGRKIAHALAARVQPNIGTEWAWFEESLSYDNARLPEALIRFGMAVDNPTSIDLGLETLAWLCEKQSSPNGLFRPIATEDFGRVHYADGVFDQQPLEAAATIDACQAALETGGGVRWAAEAERAYDWYFGGNDLGVSLVDGGEGECYDGLTWAGANLNQGAESVLSFQLANCAMQTLIRASCAPSVR